ncbi:DUF1829 domain-containing protein [Clostridium sp. AM48-13]|uniref:DUF1829 domain-containing protein n=1 Tax=Clostridium TaxID=1485 RepID=UPI000E49C014|nr:DUF1829 domain-containing protein [Clostridium fessum]RHQ18730.1 DUF1829 domain-containing protein [Clostridium sp. AM48-13]DAU04838.1 MAG TPA: protein of unknown function DUF1829 [Caudoviricetes sp.]
MDIQKCINDYADWLKSEITFTKMGEYFEITTPFLDSYNDYFQIYVRQDGENVHFSDDGQTLNSLAMSGFQLTPNRKVQLKNILSQYGIKLKQNELIAVAPMHDFPQAKHMFVQAMIRVSDLYMTSRTKVSSLFLDDIQEFFHQNHIYCTEDVQFRGKSGFFHNYDFVLQRTQFKPERLCMAINNPTKSTIGNALFSWNDTKSTRKKDSQLIVLLNDNNNFNKNITDALTNYDVKSILWSERSSRSSLDLLSA